MICDKHGEYESEQVEVLGNIISIGCPVCIEDEERQEREEIKRYENQKRINRIRSMNIEPMYQDVSFDNFQTPTKELEKAKQTLIGLVDGKIKKVFMLGRNGTGKTHLACAALIKIGGKIMTMYEISTKIRSSYTSAATETELDIVNNLASIPLLVIDEIGRTKGSDSEMNWLSFIIDKRHVRGLPLIMISNKHKRADCKNNGCDGCIERYIGDDVISRISENGVIINFTGKDYRRSEK